MKNGVTKDTESYNKRIGGKDRDTRQATEGTREASTTAETRVRDRRRGKEREMGQLSPARHTLAFSRRGEQEKC